MASQLMFLVSQKLVNWTYWERETFYSPTSQKIPSKFEIPHNLTWHLAWCDVTVRLWSDKFPLHFKQSLVWDNLWSCISLYALRICSHIVVSSWMYIVDMSLCNELLSWKCRLSSSYMYMYIRRIIHVIDVSAKWTWAFSINLSPCCNT